MRVSRRRVESTSALILILDFSVDTHTRPAKGVKGKGSMTSVSDSRKAAGLAENIISKYLGGIENPLGKFLMNRLEQGKETVLEITPRYFTVWDDSKSP